MVTTMFRGSSLADVELFYTLYMMPLKTTKVGESNPNLTVDTFERYLRDLRD